MMRSASRQALAVVSAKQDSVLNHRLSADTITSTADELYAVGALLVSQPRLRRTLGDPATAPERRVALIDQLLEGKVGKYALEIVQTAVAERWSTPWDLTDALESAGDDALFSAADKDGNFDTVEDELFRLERILDSEGEVTGLLDEVAVPPARRNALIDSLVGGKVSALTLSLLHHAVASERKRSILLAIDDLLERAATRRHRSVARVISAVPMTAAQINRLATTLTDMYGRPISVRTAVDASLRGGLVIRVGDEVIDGSIATRFAQARAQIAG